MLQQLMIFIVISDIHTLSLYPTTGFTMTSHEMISATFVEGEGKLKPTSKDL